MNNLFISQNAITTTNGGLILYNIDDCFSYHDAMGASTWEETIIWDPSSNNIYRDVLVAIYLEAGATIYCYSISLTEDKKTIKFDASDLSGYKNDLITKIEFQDSYNSMCNSEISYINSSADLTSKILNQGINIKTDEHCDQLYIY